MTQLTSLPAAPTLSVSANTASPATPENATGHVANDSTTANESTLPVPGSSPALETSTTAQLTSTEPTTTLTAAAPEPGATPKPAVVPAPSTATAEAPQAVSPPQPTPAAAAHVDTQPTLPAVATPAPTSTNTTTTSPATDPAPAPASVVENKEAEEPEPQTTLTERFTGAEWAALKEFRADLPQIFADGFPDDPKAKDKPITFWGVHIDPNQPKDARVSVVLMKFLRARYLSVRDARDMLVSTLRWRTSINIDAVMNEEFPKDVFGNVGHVYGRDKEGRPVVYNIYGGDNLAEVFRDTERFIRWRVALQEKCVAMLDFTEIDQTVQIHDYLGVGLTSRDAKSKAAASEATNIFQSHYPELLYKKFFVNVPTLMNWIFWAFKPLMPAATLAKMTVVGTGHHALKKALLPVIDAKELPKNYGGNAQGF